MRMVLAEHLAQFRGEPYETLCANVQNKHIECACPSGPNGAAYQIEINFFWDGKQGGDVRVMGSIDESPHRSLWGFIPIYVSAVTDSFIMRPDGSFVDEEQNESPTKRLESD